MIVYFCLVQITSRFVLLELFGIHIPHINQARDEIHALPTLTTKLKHQDNLFWSRTVFKSALGSISCSFCFLVFGVLEIENEIKIISNYLSTVAVEFLGFLRIGFRRARSIDTFPRERQMHPHFILFVPG